MKLFILGVAALAAAPAFAADSVVLSSNVFVERTVTEGGRTRTTLEAPNLVVPGEKLVFVLDYRNAGDKPATDFVVTNPLPSAVAYQGTNDAGASVSVDGGKSWGTLATLTVKQADGALRPAQTADVTHVRWRLTNAIPAGGTGKMSFRGTVK